MVGDGEMGGMILAMSIGARDTLSVGTEWAFKATGLAHLLVVSGFQVTVVHYVVSTLLRWVLGWAWVFSPLVPVSFLASLGGLGASLLFVAVAGVDGASVRAALAAIFTVVGASLERRRGLIGGIGASMLGLALLWPGSILEPGVQLTYAALWGIVFGRNICGENGESSRLATAVGVTVGVWLLSSLVSLAWFRTFSPLGLILNPLLAPLAGVIGCHGGILGFGLYVVGLDSAGLVLQMVGSILIATRDLVGIVAGSGLTVGELSGWATLGVIGLILVASAYLLHRQAPAMEVGMRGCGRDAACL